MLFHLRMLEFLAPIYCIGRKFDMEINLTVDKFLRKSSNLIRHVIIDYLVFVSAAYFSVPAFQASCACMMTLYKYFKSELPCNHR